MRVYVDLEAWMGESLEIHECLRGKEFQIFSRIVGGIPPIFLLPLVVEVYVYVTHTAIIRQMVSHCHQPHHHCLLYLQDYKLKFNCNCNQPNPLTSTAAHRSYDTSSTPTVRGNKTSGCVQIRWWFAGAKRLLVARDTRINVRLAGSGRQMWWSMRWVGVQG